ncbi:MAG: DUF3179 domain-containing protein [Gaiellaceae bacterium]
MAHPTEIRPIATSARRGILVVAGALAMAALAVACAGDDGEVAGGSTGIEAAAFAPADEAARDRRVERIRRSSRVACGPARRFNAIRTGAGPLCAPFDSIPAVNDPEFAPVGEGVELAGDEPVVALSVAGEHRAYPVRYLIFHELVNDRVGSTSIVVSFCPLCNSAVAHERQLDGKTLSFGVSGQLAYANLVMFDRETASLWQQMTGLATGGELKDRRLEPVPVQMVSVDTWTAAHPDGLMLQPPDMGAYPYGTDPYGGYDTDPAAQSPVLQQSAGPVRDTRLSPKWRVVGAVVADTAIAFPMPEEEGGVRVVEARVDETPLVTFFEHGTIEAETDRDLADGRRGWSGAVWIARHEGRELVFEVRAGEIVESETGSRFDLLGVGRSGDLEGVQLAAPQQLTSFWFSWVHFYPESLLAGDS